MEVSLTIDELYLLLKVNQEGEYSRRKFAAALKGIDLDEDKEQEQPVSDFEEIRKKADAQLAGKSEEEYVFDLIGIEIDTDDD